MYIRPLALSMLAIAAPLSWAAADCTCRARGLVAQQGEVVCLSTAQGERMARCDKVLNNASWTFLDGPCRSPSISSSPAPPPEQLAAAAPQPDRY